MRALVVVVAAVTSAGGCAYWPLPWPSRPYNDWQVARSKRFVTYARNEVALPPVLLSFERASAVLQATLFKNTTLGPVELLLLDWPTFRPLLGFERTGATVATLPGQGPQARHGLVLAYQGDETTAGALHRLLHLYLHASAPRAPLWLHEGLAGWVEQLVFRDDPKEPSACLGQLPQKQGELPLADLFGWSWAAYDDAGVAATGGPSPAAAFRGSASNLVDYFMMGEDGKLRDRFSEVIILLGEGMASEAAIAKVFKDLTPETLKDKLAAHRRAAEATARGPCPLPMPVPAEPFAASAKPRSEEVAPEDIEALFLRVRLLPRRGGQVDWFPPEMIGIAGGQLAKPEAATPAKPDAAKPEAPPAKPEAATPAKAAPPAGKPEAATPTKAAPPAASKPEAATPAKAAPPAASKPEAATPAKAAPPAAKPEASRPAAAAPPVAKPETPATAPPPLATPEIPATAPPPLAMPETPVKAAPPAKPAAPAAKAAPTAPKHP